MLCIPFRCCDHQESLEEWFQRTVFRSKVCCLPRLHSLALTPIQTGRGQKRNADVLIEVSHSVVGADLRKRRKRRAECTDSPATSENFPALFDKKEYFAYFGHPQYLTLDQGRFVMQKKLEEIGFELSPTQEDCS